MSCQTCKCNTCARSAELWTGWFTPGEVGDVERVCYICDDCWWYDGAAGKSRRTRLDCPGYQAAQKYVESKRCAEDRRAEKEARAARSRFTVIRGGKD